MTVGDFKIYFEICYELAGGRYGRDGDKGWIHVSIQSSIRLRTGKDLNALPLILIQPAL